MDRRTLLKLAGSALLTSACRRLPSDPPPAPPPDTPLVIDAHAHLFNGADVHTGAFLKRVVGRSGESLPLRLAAQAIAPVVEALGRGTAPSATRELELLQRPEAAAPAGALTFSVPEAIDRDAQYRRSREALQVALRRARLRPGALAGDRSAALRRAEDALALQIEELPEDYAAYRSSRSAARALTVDADSGIARGGAMLEFVLEMLQWRSASLQRYLETQRAGVLEIDLLTPSLVDFDWWIAGGRETESTLAEQLQLAERLALFSRGRVHGFAPFDPLKEVIHRQQNAPGPGPLDRVREATLQRGCIGVKLYPPMGFAVAGNARGGSGATGLWAGKAWLPDVVTAPDFATRLDRALEALYAFCEGNGVPIMAHSSLSNRTDDDFIPLLEASAWRDLYAARAPALIAGHLSGFGSGADAGEWTEFLELLCGPRGPHADTAYWRDVVADPDGLQARLTAALGRCPGAFSRRLVYGSDWKMILMEPGSDNYLQRVVQLLERLEADVPTPGLRQAVLGDNAVRFLGLQRGGQTRQRLERFYGRHEVPTPGWMRKVDA